MSVQSQIDRIGQNVADTYAVLDALGADMPSEQNSDNLARTAGTAKAVLYSKQTLTDEQKEQARQNIGVPDALPNPHALTINGKSYDGSEPVDLVITGGGASENIPLGQTPVTLSQSANIKLVGEGEYSYTVKGKTFGDVSSASISKTMANLTDKGGYYELETTGGSAWYESYVTLGFSGLTVGTKYVLVAEGYGVIEGTLGSTHYIIKNANGTTIGTLSGVEVAKKYTLEFTADTTSINVLCYISDYYFSRGAKIARFNDFYINEAKYSTERTGVYNESGTFTDSYSLGQLANGVTITTTPSCEVYAVSGGGSGEASAPLEGKTVVCFGDSLFGMYTGGDSAPAYVAKKTGATVYNVGFGGCRMSEHPYASHNPFCMYALANAVASGAWSLQDAAADAASDDSNFPDQLAILKSIDFNAVDYIVIHYGTNDFYAGMVIDNPSNPKATNTFCGAFRHSVETLLSAFPKLKIFVSLPAFRFWTADNGTVTYSDEYKNGNGNILPDFVKALAEAAKEYNLPVIDCYYGLGINKSNAATFMDDGVHHNVDGRKRFGEYIGAKLISEGDTFHCSDSGAGGSGGGGSGISVTAEVGQTIIVKAVDSNGKPTEWEAADYQPRTHWSEEVAILPETTIVPDEDDNLSFAPSVVPSIGDMCEVTYNGTEYECKAMDGSALTGIPGSVLLGNFDLLAGTGDTGEPFILVVAMAGEGGGMIIPLDGSETFTMSIKSETVTKIPVKYIPDEINDYAPYYLNVFMGIDDADKPAWRVIESVTTLEQMIDAGRQVIAKMTFGQQGTYYLQIAADGTADGKRIIVFMAGQVTLRLVPQDDGTYIGNVSGA